MRQQRIEDLIKIALDDLVELVEGEVDAVVRDAVLRIVVGPDALGAVARTDLGAARALIRENIEKLRLIGETRIYRRDATKLGPCRGASFDLIFLDPPYGAGLGERALASAQDGGWIAPEALIVWEEAADAAPDCSGFALLDERRYGATTIRVLRVD